MTTGADSLTKTTGAHKVAHLLMAIDLKKMKADAQYWLDAAKKANPAWFP